MGSDRKLYKPIMELIRGAFHVQTGNRQLKKHRFRKLKTLIIFFLSIYLIPSNAIAEETNKEKWRGNLSILVGAMSLSNPDWVNLGLSKQRSYGIDYDLAKERWPASILIGIHRSADTANYATTNKRFDVELVIEELDIGIKKYFLQNGKLSPFLATGISALRATQNSNCTSGCSTAVVNSKIVPGLFLSTGFHLRIKKRFYLGLGFKVLTGSKMNNNLDANYSQTYLLFGVES